MSHEAQLTNFTGEWPAQRISPQYSLPRIVVFLAGTRTRIETAVREARHHFPDRHLVFVCEPEQREWVLKGSSESIYIVAQPFNPFGIKAAALRQVIEAAPIEACALVVADIGFESVRFRVFALRLRTSCFFLLRPTAAEIVRQMSRASFVIATGSTLFVRIGGRAIITCSEAVRNCSKAIRSCSEAARTCSKAMRIYGRARRIGGKLAARIRPYAPATNPSYDQASAVGLAWLARFLPHYKFSRAGRGRKEIVHILPTIGMGGVQRQLVLLLKNRSPAHNHRVVVMCSDDQFFGPELAGCGVPVYFLNDDDMRATVVESSCQPRWTQKLQPVLNRFRNSFPFCWQILKLTFFLRALEPRPDIIHCWLLVANLAGSIAARLAGMRLVVTSVRNIQSEVDFNYYNPRWQRPLECATVPLANVITANAPAVAEDYRKFTGAPLKKVVTVPNGVDIAAFRFFTQQERTEKRQGLGLAPEDLVVGTVARLAKEKDFETFLRAFALARQRLPKARCFIAGDGPLRSQLKEFAASLALSTSVQFLGERKDVGDLIQCYDVFFLTSVIEGMPNVVMESQLLGTPVVATRAGGTVDLIRDGETGLLASIGDAQALASCLVRMLAEDGLRNRIKRVASEQIRNGYTVEQLVARTENIYQQLVGGNSRIGKRSCVV